MTDNTVINPGVFGDNIRDIDRGTAKTQVIQLDAGGTQAESLISQFNPLPTTDKSNIDGSNTFELLSQILLELRILNQQEYEQNILLSSFQTGKAFPGSNDEPFRMRNDPSLFLQ